MPAKKYLLRGDAIVLPNKNRRLRIITEDGVYFIEGDSATLRRKFVELCDCGLFIDFEEEPQASPLRLLAQHGLLIRAPKEGGSEIQRLNSIWGETVSPGGNVQTVLQKSSVAILGCGGTGCLIAQSLAGSGVGGFTLIDFDHVTAGNLNRQFAFSAADIGSYKVDALASRLHQDQGVRRISLVNRKIVRATQLADILSTVDLIICCADSPPGVVQKAVGEALLGSGKAALFGGVGVWKSTIGPLIKSEPEIRAFLAWVSTVLNVCAGTIVSSRLPSNGITNSLTANLIALEAFRYLSGVGDTHVAGRSVEFSMDTLSFQRSANPATGSRQ